MSDKQYVTARPKSQIHLRLVYFSFVPSILEQLAFNAQKLRGHLTLATLLFEKKLNGHFRTVPGNTLVKYEVRTFNHIGAISILTPKM